MIDFSKGLPGLGRQELRQRTGLIIESGGWIWLLHDVSDMVAALIPEPAEPGASKF